MSSPFHPSGPAQPPVADGSIHPDALGWSGVTALRSDLISVPVPSGLEAVTAERIDARFLPDSQALADKAADGCRFRGSVVRPFTLQPHGGRPRILFLDCPRYEVAESDGGAWRAWQPLPEQLAPALGIERSLEAGLMALLGYHTVDECHRCTLAPYDTIRSIAEDLPAFQLEAVAGEEVRPDGVTLATVHVQGASADHVVLHVVALERDRSRCWTLAVLDGSRGLSEVVAGVVRAVAALPLPTHKTWITAFGRDRRDRRAAAAVVERLQAERPVYVESADFDWTADMRGLRGHVLAQEVARLNQGLAALASQAPLSVDELGQRALVRQGFCATALVPLELVRERRDAR